MITTTSGLHVEISRIDDRTFRIRAGKTDTFSPSLPERLAFVEKPGSAGEPDGDDGTQAWFAVEVGHRLTIDRSDASVLLESPENKAVVRFVLERSGGTLGGPCIGATMRPAEAFHGFGFQRTALDLRGHAINWQRTYRSTEATVPYFMSSVGYGLYSNNTFHHRFDFTPEAEYRIEAAGGEIDLFLFCGSSCSNLLDSYTAVTGRPLMLPRWAMGLLYICRYYEDARGVLEIAREFRRRDIPCDMIGLEPGWERVPYSMSWEWSPERFPDPSGMIEELHGMGFRFELWESGAAPKSDYTDERIRKEWYAKRVPTSVEYGVDFYKQDDPYPRMITSEEMYDMELDAPIEGSGVVPGAALSNLANSLYSRTAFEEFTRHTGKRAMIMFHSYMASVASHRWGFAWAGDFAAGCGPLSASLSGHSTVSLDMKTARAEGVHYGFLTPVSIIDSWASYVEPWRFSGPHERMIRDYSRLRQRLWPYLYLSHHQSAERGLPMMRAMLIEEPDDPRTSSMTSQHMLGDHLLVGSGEEGKGRIYLPEGRWIDCWTGRWHDGRGEEIDVDYPAGTGGPLFVRAGALIPTAPAAPNIGTDPLELVILDAYPWGSSETGIYEDDGVTYSYREGAFATTAVTCARSDESMILSIGERRGSFEGMSRRRAYLVRLFTETRPVRVAVGGKPLVEAQSVAALLSGTDALWCIDPVEGCAVIKVSSTWRVEGEIEESSQIDAASVVWTSAASTGKVAEGVELDVRLGNVVMERRKRGFAVPVAIPDELRAPMHLSIVANPPERVALTNGGTWLPYRVTIFGTITRAGRLDTAATEPVELTVTDADGTLLHRDSAVPRDGQVVFRDVDYIPELSRFVLSCGEVKTGVLRIGDIPHVPGLEYRVLLPENRR